MDNRFKRLNKIWKSVSKILNKHSNDGYYLEEWKKDMEGYLKKSKELNINLD